MFDDDFDAIWQVLRNQGTVHESMHLNVTLVTGRFLPDVRLYDKRITRDDNGTITKREAIFMDSEGMSVIPLEDIVEMVIL
jgi:hypothetical protein